MRYLLALCIMLVPVTQAHAMDRSIHCQYASLQGSTAMDVTEVDRTIACAVHHFPVQGYKAAANCVAEHESGDRATAVGGGLGVYQFIRSTWDSVWAAHSKLEHRWGLKNNVLNGRSNVVLAIFTVHSVGAWRTTWTHPECGI